MDFFHNFVSILFYTLWIFIVISFIFVVIRIIMDVFRDGSLGGWGKFWWIFFIIVFPVIGSLVYLFARGQGMAQRDVDDAKRAHELNKEYAKSLVGEGGAASEIEKAKALLDSGAITPDEFAALKAKALG